MRVSRLSLAGIALPPSMLRGLSAMEPGDVEFYGPGGRWINNGCYIGPPEGWESFQREYLCSSCYTSCQIPCPPGTCGNGRVNCPPDSPCVTKPADVPMQAIPTLTPQNIIPPLPDITRTLAPEPVPVPSCSPWCVINGWIGENPFLAAAIVLGTAALLWPKGGR